jgi:anti-sigma regulatory factor (Ser/Thr protein kinase)
MEDQLHKFAYTVIEISGTYLHTQCKEKMRVLAKHEGSCSYPGPEQNCPERWKHTSSFYVMKPTMMGLYIATNLHDNFHYQVLPKRIIPLLKIWSNIVGSIKVSNFE